MQKYNILLRASKAIWLLLTEQKAKRDNSAEPDQMPQNAAYYQVLYC